jgi:hypothetical protein
VNSFIGIKVVFAKPMTRADYNLYRGWELPADEDGRDAGMLVEYTDGGKSNHPEHEGYISWSPLDVFERAYRPTTGMTFGMAIQALKIGKKVARTGWNGKGMWLSLSCDKTRAIPAAAFWSRNNVEYAMEQPLGQATVLPCITMKTATGEILMGWLASQTDMLAEDWELVE